MELKDLIEKLQGAFEAFKSANDERLKQLEAKGKADPLLEEKVDRANADITAIQSEIAGLKRLPQAAAGKDGKRLTEEQAAHSKGFVLFMRKGREDGLRELEQKAMSVGSDPDGGYFVPVDQSGRLVQKVYETSPIRQIAAVETISTDALEGMYDDGEAGTGGWVGETAARAETSTPQVGMWKIPVHEQYAEPRQTQKLLDDSAFDVEAWLARKVAEKFAREENSAFVNGSGVGKPRGFLTYAAGTGRDQIEQVNSGAAGAFAAANPGDRLIDLVFKVKAAYRQNAGWVMARNTVAACRKLKDGQGNYLWQPDFGQRQGGTLIGYAITEAEDMPALAADSLSIAFGDFREAYQVVDRIGIRVLRDPYTAKPFVKFYTTKRVGGDVLNFEALKLMKFAA